MSSSEHPKPDQQPPLCHMCIHNTLSPPVCVFCRFSAVLFYLRDIYFRMFFPKASYFFSRQRKQYCAQHLRSMLWPTCGQEESDSTTYLFWLFWALSKKKMRHLGGFMFTDKQTLWEKERTNIQNHTLAFFSPFCSSSICTHPLCAHTYTHTRTHTHTHTHSESDEALSNLLALSNCTEY